MADPQLYIEKDLLKKLSEDDTTAFAQLYDHYWNRLYSLARTYFKSPQEAEDLVQDVFLKVWTVRRTLSEVRSFRPFLLVMARNMIISHLRKTIFYDELQEDGNMLVEDDFVRPDNLLTLKEYSTLVQEAISALPPQQQRAFTLSRTEAMTYDEIAHEMQVSPLTVRTHISKALAFIRQYLRDRSVHLAFIILLLRK